MSPDRDTHEGGAANLMDRLLAHRLVFLVAAAVIIAFAIGVLVW